MKPLLALAAACVALAACSSTPAPRYHSLLSASSATASEAAATAIAVEFLPVGVPAAVDQPEWVVRMPDDSLRVLEQELWVAPLRDELRAALSERLSARYGVADARNAPALPAWRLKVDVLRFESVAGREAWLDSVWSASPSSRNGAVYTCRASLREPAAGELPALAAAHRRAVARLADGIGQRLQALSRGELPACGP